MSSSDASEALERLTQEVGRRFRTFGGGRVSDPNNPIAHWTKDGPLTFAAGVDVADVVRFVAAAALGAARPGEPILWAGRSRRVVYDERCYGAWEWGPTFENEADARRWWAAGSAGLREIVALVALAAPPEARPQDRRNDG